MAPHPHRRAGPLLVALGATLWGTTGVAATYLDGVAAVAAAEIAFWRLALAAPVLAVVAMARGTAWAPLRAALTPSYLPATLTLGVGVAAFQAAYFAAVALAGVTLATLTAICLPPFMLALLARAVLGETISRRTWLCMPAAVAGAAAMIALAGDGAVAVATSQAEILAGSALAVGAAGAFALFTVASRRLTRVLDAPQMIALGFGIAAGLLLPVAAASGLGIGYPPAGWAWLAYIALIPTGLAYIFFFTGMRTTPAAHAGLLVLMEPLAAALLAWLLLGERLAPGALAGAGVLLAALTALYWPGRASPPAP